MADRNVLDIASLKQAMAEGWQPKFVLFWGHTPKSAGVGKHVLSQWWPCTFNIDGQNYSSAEQYMMAEKARLFGDESIAAQMLATDNPGKIKALGREVKGFDEALWDAHRFDIVVRGSVAKFGQDTELKAYLLETGDKVLVEASPVDFVWGVGLAADDPRCEQPDEWQGLNLLGFALMQARSLLRAGE